MLGEIAGGDSRCVLDWGDGGVGGCSCDEAEWQVEGRDGSDGVSMEHGGKVVVILLIGVFNQSGGTCSVG